MADKMPKLTETYVRKIGFSKTGTQKFWDSDLKGFVLFVGKRSKTWYFQKDVGGRTQRILLGRYPVISGQAARQTALGLAVEMGRGAGKVAQIGAPNLKAAMETYLARPKLRSEVFKSAVQDLFSKHLSDWLALPLDEISKSMVVRRHADLAKAPSTANHTLRYFRSVWNHARRTCDLPECPTMAIEWYEEVADGQIIEDLRKWRYTIEALPNPIHSVFFEMLLFTGFRKSELLSLTWPQVLEDRIRLPMTKNGRAFDLPILQHHHEILAPLRGLHREWVFPSPKSPTGHLSAPTRIPWSPHSHRRTFATVAVEAGVLEEIVGRLLNHTPASVTGRRYVMPSLDALRPSMKTVCEALTERSGMSAPRR